jgi:hypothetical protein
MAEVLEFLDDNDNVIGTYKSDRKMSQADMENVYDSYSQAGLLDPENQKMESLTTHHLEGNTGLHDAYKTYYKRKYGEAFKGTPQELVAAYKEDMRYYNTNISSMAGLAAELGSDYYTEEERQSLGVMFNIWDNTQPWYNEENGKWDAFLDFGEAAVTDITNWAGLFSGGTATAGGLAAKQLAGASIRKLLAEGLKKGAVEGVKQGAIWAVPESVARQYNKGELGIGDGVDLAETAKDVGMGAATGGVLGGSIGTGLGANRFYKNKKQADFIQKAKDDLKVENFDMLDEDVLAVTNWAETLKNPNIKGEVRQAARQQFISELSEGFVTRLNGAGQEKLSIEQATKLALESLETKLFKSKEDFAKASFEDIITAMEKAQSGGTKAGIRSDHFSALAYQMEAMSLAQFKKAWANNSPLANQLWDNVTRTLAMAEQSSSQAGRSLAFTKMRERLDTLTFASVLEDMSKKDDWTSAEMIDALNTATLKGSSWKAKTVRAFNEAWIHNILGGLNTLVVNTGGSYAHMVERSLIEVGAGAKTALTGKGTQQLREGLTQLVMEQAYMGHALMNSLRSLGRGRGMIDPSRAVDEAKESIAIGTRDFEIGYSKKDGFNQTFTKQADESIGTYAVNIFGNVNRFIGGRGMAATDDFVKTMAFRGKLYSKLLEENLAKANTPSEMTAAIKKTWKDVDVLVEQHIDSIGTGRPPSDKRIQAALEEARESTFQGEFKNDVFGKVGKTTGGFVNKHPVFRQIMPFVRTPANLLSHMAQRTPGLQSTSEELKRMLASSNPAERNRALMIMNVGTVMWAGAFMAAGEDRLQGDGMSDYARTKTTAISEGKLQDSIELGEDGKRYGFRKLDPYSRPARIVAAAMDAVRNSDSETAFELYTVLAGTTMKALIDMPTTQGITQIASVLQDNTGGSSVGKLLDKKLQSSMPYYRLYNEILRMSGQEQEIYEMFPQSGEGTITDNKATDYIGRSIQRAYPGLQDPNDPLDKKRDPIFGYAFTKPQEWGFAISGIPTKEGKAEAVMEEIDRLGMTVTPPPPVIPGSSLDMRKMTVKPQGTQTVYDYYQDLVGRIKPAQYEGRTLYEELERVITSDGFYREELKDSSRFYGVVKDDANGREKRIKSIISTYRSIALSELRKPEHLGASHPFSEQAPKALNQFILNDTQQGQNKLNSMKQDVRNTLTGE